MCKLRKCVYDRKNWSERYVWKVMKKFLYFRSAAEPVLSNTHWENLFNKMAYITNSHQFHKSHRKYKSEKGVNTDLWIYQRWDQVPRKCKHPLLTGHTRREPYIPDLVYGINRSQNQCVKNGLSIVMKHIRQHLS
jgi:hypothetical protein